jgi:hypothetical protein
VLSTNNLTKIVSDIIVLNTANVVTDVQNRLEYGESVRGGIIGRYRDPMYAEYKQRINPNARGNVDLILTGSLVDNLTLKKISEGVYQIISTDEKYTKLANKYGSYQFGITDEQRYSLYEDIEKVAIAEVLKQSFA